MGLASCPDGQFQCIHSQECLSMELVCDFHPNCADGSDEEFCGSYNIVILIKLCFPLLMTHLCHLVIFNEPELHANKIIALQYRSSQALATLMNMHADGLTPVMMNLNGVERWQTSVMSLVLTIPQDHLGVGLWTRKIKLDLI